jgi:hypothetical protein
VGGVIGLVEEAGEEELVGEKAWKKKWWWEKVGGKRVSGKKIVVGEGGGRWSRWEEQVRARDEESRTGFFRRKREERALFPAGLATHGELGLLVGRERGEKSLPGA